MNRISLAFTLGMATQAALAASPDERQRLADGPAADRKERPATVVLPNALQRERKVGVTLSMGNGKRLRVGLLSGRRALSHTLPFGTSAPLRQLAGIEFDQRFGWGYASVKFGAMRNSNPLLGKPVQENTLWRQQQRTAFSSVAMGYNLTPSLALVGMVSFGRTSSTRNEIDRLKSTPASAAALSIGLSARDLVSKGDHAGIALIAPTRAVGFANVDGTPGAPHGLALGARYQIEF